MTTPGPSPAPVTTTVVWDSVVGSQLEELLYGLFEELGADELVWRAGSSTGVTASDGGRDLEAVFDQPTPDGELDRTRWWVEAKGRTGTVAKEDVVNGVHNMSAQSDIDVYVFATNSRFSNPTRDWVKEWQRKNPRPKIRLWDRERLARLVREHPTVAARVLPEALDDEQRLRLLLDRFRKLGETPTELDLQYFWERKAPLGDFDEIVTAVTMFTYSESQDGLVERPWSTWLPGDENTSLEVMTQALVSMPLHTTLPIARPLDRRKAFEAAAYLIVAVMDRLPADIVYKTFTDPFSLLDEETFGWAKNREAAIKWREFVGLPTLARIQAELEQVCGGDCVRVDTDPDIFSPPMTGGRYWRRFQVTEESEDKGRIVIEQFSEPCAVGLPLDAKYTCPLVSEPELTLNRIEELQKIVAFRREHPEGERTKYARPIDIDTVLEAFPSLAKKREDK